MTSVRAIGLLTGWGTGTAALPQDASTAAAGRRVIAIPRPALDGERFRRATRECLLGVSAVEAMLRDAGLDRAAISGPSTALVYVTAAAYGASNRAFIAAAGAGGAAPAAGTLHFPYTAPSAVPAEVAIEYGLRGGYVILIGGAAATVDALWQAARLLVSRRCERALVLAVETFAECEDLWARAGRAVRGPLVEGAACALVEGDGDVGYAPAGAPAALETLTARRAGEVLGCGPLVGLALAREAGDREARVTGQWRGRRASVTVALPRAGQAAYA
jgi:hypothetical protein